MVECDYIGTHAPLTSHGGGEKEKSDSAMTIQVLDTSGACGQGEGAYKQANGDDLERRRIGRLDSIGAYRVSYFIGEAGVSWRGRAEVRMRTQPEGRIVGRYEASMMRGSRERGVDLEGGRRGDGYFGSVRLVGAGRDEAFGEVGVRGGWALEIRLRYVL